MLAALDRCPSCDSPLSAHDARCAACGQPVGADNVCEHCHALAAAEQREGRLVCSVCGGARTAHPHTVVESPEALRRAPERVRLQRRLYAAAASVSALVGASAGALVGVYGQNPFERGLALALALILLGLAALLMRQRSRVAARAEARAKFMLEQRVIGFAHQQRGAFTAEQAARSLRIPVAVADSLLERMVRADQANMEVTERGEIEFSLKALPAGRTVEAPTPRVGAGAAARRQTESH